MVESNDGTRRARLWDRPATRRAMLAAGATGAAVGTAALVLGLSKDGDNDNGETTIAGSSPPPAPTETATAAPVDATATPTEASSSGQVEDPRQRAGHLLRRAGFGGMPEEIDEFAGLSREEAADRLIGFEDIDNSALGLTMEQFDIYDRGDARRQWLTRMAQSARPLEERMTLVWHGLLVSQISQLGGPYQRRIRLMDDQVSLYRSMALPVYDDLLKSVSKNPAMMVYLNTAESSREHPNENYGRELLELFSKIGRASCRERV